MSIIVKDMEMPKTCYDCYFCRTYDEPNQGYFCIPLFADLHRTDFTKKRIDACPLIEVPPHGRLIDANPIMKFIQDGLNNGEFGYDQIKVMGEIQYAPTIIESEDE